MNAQRLLAIFLMTLAGLPACGQTPVQPPSAQPPPPTPPPTTAVNTSQTLPQLNLYYLGKRRSNLEPCGCKARMESGVQYEAAIYEQFPQVPALRLDAGEWTNVRIEEAPLDAMKTRYVLRALKRLDFDAVNVGLADIQLSAEYYKNFLKSFPQEVPNWVSANVFEKSQPGKPAFPTHRIVKRKLPDGREITIGITGATAFQTSERNLGPIKIVNTGTGKTSLVQPTPLAQPEADPRQLETVSYLVKPAAECLAPVIAELRPKVDLLIVLYAGDFAGCLKLARAFPQVDCMIDNGRAMEPPVYSYLEGGVRIFGVDNQRGRAVRRATLVRDGAGKWQLPVPPAQIAVNKEFAARKELVDLIEKFKEETKTLEFKEPGPEVERIYAGSHSCKECHKAEFQQWSRTHHAHAMQTLVERNQQFNPECLKCHVVGWRHANGFYSVKSPMSQAMLNVGCENCHGPSLNHVTSQLTIAAGAKNWMTKPGEYEAFLKKAKDWTPAKKVPAEVCIKCHTPENDDNFVYDKKILKVMHTGPEALAQDAATSATMTPEPQPTVRIIKVDPPKLH